MHCLNHHYWLDLKCLLRYLNCTIAFGLHITPLSFLKFHAFSGADWAGDPSDRTTTSGYFLYFGHVLISWSWKRQKTVVRSSTKVEYTAVTAITAEFQWVKSLLQELGYWIPPSKIYCDNISTMYTCQNLVLHSKMKHLEIDIHFVRDLVQKGALWISHISSKNQITNLFSKPLSKHQFQLNKCHDLNFTYRDGTYHNTM